MSLAKRIIPCLDVTKIGFDLALTLEKLRDILLPKLMSGEVRVAVAV